MSFVSQPSSTPPTARIPYEPRSILLTGGAGFIGSHVLAAVVRAHPNATVVCLDSLEYCASLNNLDEVKNAPNFKFVKGDIRSADLVTLILDSEAVDTIMHFAAQTHVDNSFGNSLPFTEVNVLGTHTLLECARVFKSQIRLFLHVSTDEVYGESPMDENEVGFRESSALNPSNPYAATKAAAEALVNAYRLSFGIPTIITRGNNAYGPHEYPEKVIPKFIAQMQRRQQCTIHGSGNQRRSFLHIDDVARAFLTIVHFGTIGETYNIGTDKEISILELAKRIAAHSGIDGQSLNQFVRFVEDRPFQDIRYRIDSSKLTALGWKPVVDFEEGLEATVQWYHGHPLHWGDISEALLPHPRARVPDRDPTPVLQMHKTIHPLPAATSPVSRMAIASPASAPAIPKLPSVSADAVSCLTLSNQTLEGDSRTIH